MNNKFWQHSVFDLKTGEELTYEDSTGLRYGIDPINSNHLLYYNDLSQEILDNLPKSSNDEKDQLFLDLFNNLYIIKDDRFPNSVFFKNNIDNQYLMEYDLKSRYFYCDYSKIWSVFESKFYWNNQQIQEFMKSRLEGYLNLPNTTPGIGYTTWRN